MKPSGIRIVIGVVGVASALVAAASCSASRQGVVVAEKGGTATADLAVAPAGAACLEISVTGSGTTVTQGFDLAPEANTTFYLSGLPLGSVLFSALAYNVACTDAGAAPQAPATWLSNQVSATLSQGVVVDVTLQMVPANSDAGGANVAVNFPHCAPTIAEFDVLTAGASPLDITTGADANLWFTEFAASKIGQISIGGTVHEFPVAPDAGGGPDAIEPFAIAAGPDGNVWFTEVSAGSIGKITPAGAVSSYLIPSKNGGPFGITAGPSDNMWFTENNSNRIGAASLGGSFQEFPEPSAYRPPVAIAAGSDGNLWYTDSEGNVDRMTPAGSFRSFTVPGIAAFADAATPGTGESYGIAAGPDGNIWFTERFANFIGKITPAGMITEFPIPSVNSQPYGIAAGPDGNLWFTEQAANNIGVISPASGMIAEYPIPTGGSSPAGLTAGPDGNLWFAESGGVGKIGRVTPYATCTDASVPAASCVAVSNGIFIVDAVNGVDSTGTGSGISTAGTTPSCAVKTITRATQLAGSPTTPVTIEILAGATTLGAATGEVFPITLPANTTLALSPDAGPVTISVPSGENGFLMTSGASAIQGNVGAPLSIVGNAAVTDAGYVGGYSGVEIYGNITSASLANVTITGFLDDGLNVESGSVTIGPGFEANGNGVSKSGTDGMYVGGSSTNVTVTGSALAPSTFNGNTGLGIYWGGGSLSITGSVATVDAGVFSGTVETNGNGGSGIELAQGQATITGLLSFGNSQYGMYTDYVGPTYLTGLTVRGSTFLGNGLSGLEVEVLDYSGNSGASNLSPLNFGTSATGAGAGGNVFQAPLGQGNNSAAGICLALYASGTATPLQAEGNQFQQGSCETLSTVLFVNPANCANNCPHSSGGVCDVGFSVPAPDGGATDGGIPDGGGVIVSNCSL